MRRAADAFDFAAREEIAVSAAVVQLMNGDLAHYRERSQNPPRDAARVGDAARAALRELEPDGAARRAATPHPLESTRNLRPRLGEIDDTVKGLAMLVELCACQPWAVLKKPKPLQKDPRRQLLDQTAILLGGDTQQEDVTGIDKVLYKRQINLWKTLPLIVGGVGVGVATAGMAAPFIGGAIGASMGLSGAAAVNAGLAALGGGSLAAGGLGIAGGTALIGGVGGVAGGGVGAAAKKVLLDNDFSAEAVRVEARKLEALVSRLKVHGQSSQARAQAFINQLGDQVMGLRSELDRERRKSAGQEERIRELEKKVRILSDALKGMEAA